MTGAGLVSSASISVTVELLLVIQRLGSAFAHLGRLETSVTLVRAIFLGAGLCIVKPLWPVGFRITVKGHLLVFKSTLFLKIALWGYRHLYQQACTSWFNLYLNWYTDRKTVHGSAVKCHLPWILENTGWGKNRPRSFANVVGETPEGAVGHQGLQLLWVCHTDICDRFQTKAKISPALDLLPLGARWNPHRWG